GNRAQGKPVLSRRTPKDAVGDPSAAASRCTACCPARWSVRRRIPSTLSCARASLLGVPVDIQVLGLGPTAQEERCESQTPIGQVGLQGGAHARAPRLGVPADGSALHALAHGAVRLSGSHAERCAGWAWHLKREWYARLCSLRQRAVST